MKLQVAKISSTT